MLIGRYYAMMEKAIANYDDHLQILTGKARDLCVKMDEIINENGFSFCSHCYSHSQHCVVAETSVVEMEKVVEIRDSLRDVYDTLLFLQRVKPMHKKQREEAMTDLEENRRLLIERIHDHQFPDRHAKHDYVLQQITPFFGDGKSKFPWKKIKSKMDQNISDQKSGNGIFKFLVDTTKFALECVVIFANGYTAVGLCKNRQQRVMYDSTNTGNFSSQTQALLLIS